MAGILLEECESFFDVHECLDGASSDSCCSFESEGVDVDSLKDDAVDVLGRLEYDVWRKEPDSVGDRRRQFLMETLLDEKVLDCKRDHTSNCSAPIEDLMEKTALRMHVKKESSINEKVECSVVGVSLLNSGYISSVHSFCNVKQVDKRCSVNDFDGDEFLNNESNCMQEVSSDTSVMMDELERHASISQLVHRSVLKESSVKGGEQENVTSKGKKSTKNWWRSLQVALEIVKRRGIGMCTSCRCDDSMAIAKDSTESSSKVIQHRMKVGHHRKLFKEFTALFKGQEIQAHKGAIQTMKFCPEGKYLASAGEDGIVRIWHITQSIELNRDRIRDSDVSYKGQPSGGPFSEDGIVRIWHITQSIELNRDRIRDSDVSYKGQPSGGPFSVDVMKLKLGHGRTSAHYVPVVIPEMFFKISEEPLHEFHGHTENILDLAWSHSKHLLSSSMDKTVRLWQVGSGKCLKIFHHNNYVTCVQFNPVDDRYFISGSIDGKARIWTIPKGQVVDWADIRSIVTAVCYRPDGKGVIVGSISGECRFYDASGNLLQLVDQVYLQNKKTCGKKITGFQFSPVNSQRMMVTSADSQIRIFDGVDIVFKYKGFRNSESPITASFTSNGRYIISASEDSYVCVWNYDSSAVSSSKPIKSTSSCERFRSGGVTVALPWSGTQSKRALRSREPDLLESPTWLGDSGRWSTGSNCLTDALSKNSVMWPEEKLLPWFSEGHPHKLATWGLVIVTANRDGRIRTFHNYGLPVRL